APVAIHHVRGASPHRRHARSRRSKPARRMRVAIAGDPMIAKYLVVAALAGLCFAPAALLAERGRLRLVAFASVSDALSSGAQRLAHALPIQNVILLEDTAIVASRANAVAASST